MLKETTNNFPDVAKQPLQKMQIGGCGLAEIWSSKGFSFKYGSKDMPWSEQEQMMVMALKNILLLSKTWGDNLKLQYLICLKNVGKLNVFSYRMKKIKNAIRQKMAGHL